MLEFSKSKKGNHVKVADVVVKFGLKIVKVGFIEVADPSKIDEIIAEIEAAYAADPNCIKLGQGFTTTAEVAGEDVATGKLYEVLVS